MINLLESMHKCCLPSGIASESPSAYEKSLVHKIFGGHLRSQVKCMECSYCSNKFDPFLDLSLEIVKADTLCKALSHFTSEEQLDGGQRQYQCQQCKQKVRALKQLTIHKAPHVLTIHLKRFGSDMPGQKIDRKVDFECTLDLKPYVSNPVCQVSEKTVLQQKAYMLFYVRNIRSSAPQKAQDIPSSCCGEPIPLKSISVSEHLLKKVVVAPTNGLVAKSQHSTLLEEHIVHSSSKISSIEQTSRVGSSPQDAKHLVVESLRQVASSKENEDHILEKDNLQNKNPSESETQARKSRKILPKHKLPKSFYDRSVLFASRRLFLAALELQKRKKLRVKRHLSAKENRITGILVENEKGDQGASTSMTVNMDKVDSMQRLHMGSGRENVSCGSGDGNSVNSGSAYAVDVNIVGSHVNNNAERNVPSGTQEHIVLKECTSSNHSSLHASMHLSKRGFWEIPIPRWDGIELPPEIDAMDGEPQSIGYILEDWEKELDQGKREKVKNSRNWFDSGNPFQDISAARADKKLRMDHTRSGNISIHNQ